MNIVQRLSEASKAFRGKGITINKIGPTGLPADHLNRFIVNDSNRLASWGQDPWESSVVYPCLRFIGEGISQSPIFITRKQSDGKVLPVSDSRQALLNRPCPEYDGVAFLKALGWSYAITGNAYAILRRDSLLQPVEMIWQSPNGIRPVKDRNGRLAGYERRQGAGWAPVDVEDVIHIRNGIDPTNQLLGVNPWKAAVTDATTDFDAARVSQLIMQNVGAVPIVVSMTPNDPKGEPIGDDEYKLLKTKLSDAMGRDKAGEPVLVDNRISIQKLALTPEEMILDKARSIPADRVCAVFGLDPMAVKLPSTSKTYSNYAEARESATEDVILPMQRLFEAAFSFRLLTASDIARGYSIRFDNSEMRQLQEDVDAYHSRVRQDVTASLCSLEEGREKLGYRSTGTFVSSLPGASLPKSVQTLAMKRAAEQLRG